MSSAIKTLYRDSYLLAVDKPAGIIVHGDGTGARTLTDEARDLLLGETGVDAAMISDIQPLQRLDRDTSGIVLFSLNKQTQPAFDRLIAQRAIEKRYAALVEGIPAWNTHTFRWPIGRDRHHAQRMRVSRTGKEALTVAHVLERFPACPQRTLLSVDLKTGRKHQIRVHLSHAGFPLVGDALYGSAAAFSSDGLMLHAQCLRFIHPITNEKITITSALPARFLRAMR